jgi:hypothetical protein
MNEYLRHVDQHFHAFAVFAEEQDDGEMLAVFWITS